MEIFLLLWIVFLLLELIHKKENKPVPEPEPIAPPQPPQPGDLVEVKLLRLSDWMPGEIIDVRDGRIHVFGDAPHQFAGSWGIDEYRVAWKYR